jgi:hypothetical protein
MVPRYTDRTLRSWVRIPLGVWVMSASVLTWVGRGLQTGPIPRPRPATANICRLYAETWPVQANEWNGILMWSRLKQQKCRNDCHLQIVSKVNREKLRRGLRLWGILGEAAIRMFRYPNSVHSARKPFAAECIWLYHAVKLHNTVSCIEEKTMDCRGNTDRQVMLTKLSEKV